MGQVRNVLVYRLLCTNTIDEKITELLEYKQDIFDAFADKSVAAEQNESRVAEVDEKKFGQLIQEEIDRINSEKGNVPQSDGESNSLVVKS
jgi:SNF2 family DNA or RNA helicase